MAIARHTHSSQECLLPLALDCPFSRRATDKPRGYPGDAELIDFLYRSDNVAEQVCRSTLLDRRFTTFGVNSPAARAVRNRKDFFTQEILRTITNNANARILVLACGHFREVDTISVLLVIVVQKLLA